MQQQRFWDSSTFVYDALVKSYVSTFGNYTETTQEEKDGISCGNNTGIKMLQLFVNIELLYMEYFRAILSYHKGSCLFSFILINDILDTHV